MEMGREWKRCMFEKPPPKRGGGGGVSSSLGLFWAFVLSMPGLGLLAIIVGGYEVDFLFGRKTVRWEVRMNIG